MDEEIKYIISRYGIGKNAFDKQFYKCQIYQNSQQEITKGRSKFGIWYPHEKHRSQLFMKMIMLYFKIRCFLNKDYIWK